MPPAANAAIDPAALELIARTPRVLRDLLLGLPATTLAQPNDEGWSLKDILAHLLDVEDTAFLERISRMLNEERPAIAAIDPPARLAAGDYAARSAGELLDELERRRTDDLGWLRGLDTEQLRRAGLHQEVGEIFVLDIAHQWAAHDMDHLRQVALMLQQHLAPLMGATRGFYDV
jgi:hypothetical protein